MKTKVLKTKTLKKTKHSEKTTIVTLNQQPSLEDQKKLFINDSIVLEF